MTKVLLTRPFFYKDVVHKPGVRDLGELPDGFKLPSGAKIVDEPVTVEKIVKTEPVPLSQATKLALDKK